MSDTSCDPTHAPTQTQVHLTVYAAPNRTRPLSREYLSVDEILDAARSTVGPREALPYVAPHALREGGTRRGADIEIVSALLWLDFDGAWGPAIRSRLSGLWWRAFPSPSGRVGRARVLVLCTRPLELREARSVLLYLDALTGGKADRACLHAVQGYWLGRLPGVAWWEDGEDGAPLDVDALDLEAQEERVLPAPTSEDLAMWPAAWRADRATEIVGRWGDAEEGGRHAALFRVAQVCRDWAVPLDVTREIVIEWNEARCKPPRELEHIDRSILARVDSYRRHPVGCALPACVKLGHEHGEIIDRIAWILAHSVDRLFVREATGGSGVKQLVILNDDGSTIDVDEHLLTVLISDHVYVVRWEEGNKKKASGWRRCDCPPALSKQFLAVQPYDAMRRLTGVLHAPTLRPDGTIITEQGWDAATGCFLVGHHAVAVPAVPTREQGIDALDGVAMLFHQFPFAGEEHRSVHLSYLLTAVALAYLRGPIPLVLFDANRRQTGKSKLATSISVVATGERQPASMQWASNDDTMASLLFSASSQPIFYFDNVATGSVLKSAAMDGMITGCKIAQRMYYTQKTGSRPCRPITIVTGNSIRIDGDFLPRTLLCRLETTRVNPEQRGDLEIRDLLGHLVDHRMEIITALLTAWRAWLAAGAPSAGLTYWHTFDAWMAVRDLLVWLGYSDPYDVHEELRGRDEGEQGLAAVLAWGAQRSNFTATELLNYARPPRFGGAAPSDDGEDDERGVICEALCRAAGSTAAELTAVRVGRALMIWAGVPCEVSLKDGRAGVAVLRHLTGVERKSASGSRTSPKGWAVVFTAGSTHT